MLKPINNEQYITCFNTFCKYSKEYESHKKIRLNTLNSIEHNYSILEVGCGSGSFTANILENSIKKPNLYTAFEPLKVFADQTKSRLRTLDFKTEVINDKFSYKTNLQRKYDVIILVHSIYSFENDLVETLRNIINHLNENGKAIIFVQTPHNSGLMTIYFAEYLEGQTDVSHTLDCWTVEDALRKLNAEYTLYYAEGDLAVTNASDKEITDIISFILQAEYYSAPVYLQKRMLDFFHLSEKTWGHVSALTLALCFLLSK